jgi:hypothetical protein
VRPIAPRVPTIEGLFGAYHRKHGR